MSTDTRDTAQGTTTPRKQQAGSSFSASTLASEIEVLATSDGKYTFDVKVLATGAKFRVSPTRDPQQPRFWCISVRQCSSVAMPDPASPIWMDRPGIPWAEMPDTIEAIRADVASWLTKPDRAALCQWLMTAAPAPTAAVMVEAESSRRRTTTRASR